jgi:chemotaxis protein MotA
MKAATGIGIGVAIVGILMSAMMDGTSPAAFMNIPALLIIIAGTAGATMASVGMDGMKRIPSLYKTVISSEPPDVKGRVDLLVSLAEQARREGLLALDAKVKEIDDDFTKKGLQLVVDGTDPEIVRDILEAEIDGMAARHASGAAPFEKAGGFAPTIGIIGTVMGLHLLSLHRHADGRRLGERHLPAGRQQAEVDVGRRGRAADVDRRRNSLRAGGRQPARGGRQAHLVRPAGGA